jgi:hypothetical protein
MPSSVGFVSLGWSRTEYMPGYIRLPRLLHDFGMPGCNLFQSAEAPVEPITITGPGTADYGLSIPNNIVLLGLTVYLQGWVAAPGYNPASVIASNGLVWRVGL